MIDKIKKQSNAWLLLGFVVVFVLSILGFEWDNLNPQSLVLLGVIGIGGAIIWWFWTMYILHQLIQYRVKEEIALQEIVERIKELQVELKKSLVKKRRK